MCKEPHQTHHGLFEATLPLAIPLTVKAPPPSWPPQVRRYKPQPTLPLLQILKAPCCHLPWPCHPLLSAHVSAHTHLFPSFSLPRRQTVGPRAELPSCAREAIRPNAGERFPVSTSLATLLSEEPRSFIH